jgi:hypothetical protein
VREVPRNHSGKERKMESLPPLDEWIALQKIMELLELRRWDHFATHEDEMPEIEGVTERLVLNLICFLKSSNLTKLMGRSVGELPGRTTRPSLDVGRRTSKDMTRCEARVTSSTGLLPREK